MELKLIQLQLRGKVQTLFWIYFLLFPNFIFGQGDGSIDDPSTYQQKMCAPLVCRKWTNNVYTVKPPREDCIGKALLSEITAPAILSGSNGAIRPNWWIFNMHGCPSQAAFNFATQSKEFCIAKGSNVFAISCNVRFCDSMNETVGSALSRANGGTVIGLGSRAAGVEVCGLGCEARPFSARNYKTGEFVQLADCLSCYRDGTETPINRNLVLKFCKRQGAFIATEPGCKAGPSSCAPPAIVRPSWRNSGRVLSGIEPGFNVVQGVGSTAEGISEAANGNVGSGTAKVCLGTGLATTSTSCGLYAIGCTGAAYTAGALALPLTAAGTSLTLAGGGTYQAYQQTPSRGYAPANGYSTSYWDCFCQLYGN